MTGGRRHTAMLRIMMVAALLVAGPAGAAAEALKVGDRLAEIDGAVDGVGKPARLKAFKGKWVVVTIGADWCKPCAKELPIWDRLAGEYKGRVVFVALDIDDDIAVGKRFHQRLKLKNMILTYLSSESAVVGKYGADKMPSSFLADKNGVVRHVRAGFETGDADGEYKRFKAQLDKLVK